MLSLAVVSLGLAIALPRATAQPQLYAHEGHSHAPGHPPVPDSTHVHSDDHEHGVLEIPSGQPVPSVDLTVHPDSRQGWNLEVRVTHFQFAPERVNQASSSQEGHAHLYIDGVKITRLYGNWYYLESLAPGTHEIRVGLNANGHEALTHNGQPIQDVEVVTVQP
ncbi:MAG: hypothetical protein Fur0046_36750 [Cyanobacteria bacterium J069]